MFAVVDIETTGGNLKTDRITEIAIIVHNGQRIIEEYSTLINPLKPIQPFVSSLTGITNEMVLDAPTFGEVVDKIEELTAGRIFVAHNVQFDYGFLKNEFRRTGKMFRRKLLCTITSSKKVFPNLPSYGLGNICQDLNISIYDRHRAHGDASATAQLLEKILFNDKKKLVRDLLENELDTAHVPPGLAPGVVDELPEDTGVYYFHNQKGQVIYVGKSKNIRDRVISHFRNDANTYQGLKLHNEICDVTYEVTGDELIALLLESEEIKRWMPEYNRAQRRKKYRYGLFMDKDQSGHYRFDIELLHPERHPLHEFRSRRRAEVFLENLFTRSGVRPELKPQLKPKTYNKRIDAALARHRFPHSNFLILGHAPLLHERSVVLIEDDRYIGYGYFDPALTGSDTEAIKACVKPHENNPDVRRIIITYMRKFSKRVTVMPF